MTPSDTQQWYALLEKPSFAPPAWLFGPVWTVLYVIIAISFGIVFLNVIRKRWPMPVAIPFMINLLSNALFTPIQFGLRSNALALLDIIIVLATIVWMSRVIWRYSRTIAWMQLPYGIWVSFATVLQASITVMNWH